jgi:xanthine dehydrogenase/oxidase
MNGNVADREIVLHVNGRRMVVRDPDPRLRLLDFLRSDEVGLTGTKKVCGQGGCGACTVALHRFNPQTRAVDTRAINACLRPLCSLDGMAITTVEGVGSVADAISPVQNRLICENGSQCGYCTPGWVMSMHSYLAGHPGQALDRRGIEQLFDGNLCRCTGYRPILYAMQHFAADFGPADEAGCMRCFLDPALAPTVRADEAVPIPPAIGAPPRALHLERDGYAWYRPLTLAGLFAVLGQHREPDDVRLVVGNTSVGIYGEPAQGITLGAPHVRVDVSHIPDLYGLAVEGDTLVMGAATTYTDALDWLGGLLAEAPTRRRPGLEALHYMAGRTAGRVVRDAASLAGNSMLVIRHVRQGTPFPSDMFTALCTMGAEIDVACPGWTASRREPLLDFAHRFQDDPALRGGAVILRYHVPLTRSGEWARTFKVALREVNAHSIVNAGFRVALNPRRHVTAAALVFGGIAPIAFHAEGLERWLEGRRWDADTLRGAMPLLQADVAAQVEASRERLRDVSDEGFTEAYRAHLAESFFYQFFVWLAEQVEPGVAAADVRSAGERAIRPATRGTQNIQTYPDEYPVSRPMVKIEGFIQATGEARYTHDLARPGRSLEGALVVSTCPLAPSFAFAVPVEGGPPLAAGTDELVAHLRERFAGFADLVTAADIPGKNEQQHVGPPDPLLCPPAGGVSACGQSLAMVLANEAQQAIDIAWYVQAHCVVYAAAGAPAPLLGFDEAIGRQAWIDRKSMVRAGSSFEWVGKDEAVIDGVHCRIVRGAQGSMSPQIHFYFETHAAIATPGERGPNSMRVQSSTQNPGIVLSSVTAALGLAANQVEIEIQRIGGGYGGKDSRTPWSAAVTAIAAAKVRRPVRLSVTRETDSALFGHSNPLFGSYDVAIGTGTDDSANKGRLMGLVTDFWINAGNTADVSPTIMDTVILRSDNSYFVPNYSTTGKVCLTNTASNTSFRSLEAISSILIHEDAIEAAAHALGMRAEEVRGRNLYRLGDRTPYGQVLDYCYLGDVWRYTRASWPQAGDNSTFDERVAAIEAFNACHRWRKRGISMVPLTYGMGWRLAAKERGDALVQIYSNDGTVLVRHGGVEMGQGLNTQVTQIVAEALNVPMGIIQIGTTSTAVIPDPTSTGACTGTSFNGGAARVACRRLRQRLEEFCLAVLREHGPAYCVAQQIDFWNHDDGWRHLVAEPGAPAGAPLQPMWRGIVKLADQQRINLSAQAQHNETGDTALDTGFTFETPEILQHFIGFTFSAAISEVEVDVLTGEVVLLRSDLVYDMGKSLNPATDVGQIEGSFVQGIGRVLTENLVYQPGGPGIGMNNTPNTWGYKIPAATTIPLELNVNLYPREQSADVPENPNLLLSAKESGEPPMCLAVTAYFAIKHAVLAARRDRGEPGWFRLDLPCSVQSVREACLVGAADLTLEPRPASA